MVSGTRSKRSIAPVTSKGPSTSTRANKRKAIKKKKGTSSAIDQVFEDPEGANLDTDFVEPEEDEAERSNGQTKTDNREDKIFRSRFPQLELETFEEDLDKWTITSLRDAIVKQDSRRSTAHKDIKDLVKVLRMDFEKRILMVALMAGVPEVVIWNLMGFGKNKGKANPWIRFLSFCIKCLGEPLPERDNKDAWVDRNQKMADIWSELSKDEKDVFRDPHFFALAGLPDYSSIDTNNDQDSPEDDATNGVNVQQFDAPALPPAVHQLSDSDKQKYQPLFDRLVNVEKVHLCHGKPEPSPSIATLQKRSLLAVKKAHHDFAVVCQRNQISYYLTSASCGGVNGWSQTFSNNVDFAKWALDTNHIPTKFANYVHGKEVAQEIEAKRPQPSDERRSKLGSVLNQMMRAQCGEKFPKVRDPVSFIKDKKWNVVIVQKEGSMLSSEGLFIGHRKATDAIVKAWSKDIENGNFFIKKISQTQANQAASALEDAAGSNQNDHASNQQTQTSTSAHTHKKRVIIDSDDSESESSDQIRRSLKDLAHEASGSGVSKNSSRKKHQPDATTTTDVTNDNVDPKQQRPNPPIENSDTDEDDNLPSGI